MVADSEEKDNEIALPEAKQYFYVAKGNTSAVEGTIRRKKQFLEALGDEFGCLSAAARRCGVSMSSYRNYYNTDEEFKVAVDDIVFAVKEDVAQTLIKRALGYQADGTIDIKKADPLAQMFYLKTQAGWNEKKQIDITHKKELIQIELATDDEVEDATVIENEQED